MPTLNIALYDFLKTHINSLICKTTGTVMSIKDEYKKGQMDKKIRKCFSLMFLHKTQKLGTPW